MIEENNNIINDLLKYYEYAEIRLATFRDKNKVINLVFASVNLLPKGCDKSYTSDLSSISTKVGQIYFRKVFMKAEDAIIWYRVINGYKLKTPIPYDIDFNEKLDNLDIQEASFTDETLFGDFGIPISEEGLFDIWGDNCAPFLGYSQARIHRRFGNQEKLAPLLQSNKAIVFLSNSLHIDLQEYKEYLGSMVLILPNPIIDTINDHLTRNNEYKEEKRLVKIYPYSTQTLNNLKFITFETYLGLLRNVQIITIPENGIISFEQYNQSLSNGYFIVHDELGCIYFKAPTAYLRQMNLSMGMISNTRKVHTKLSAKKNSPIYDYDVSEVGYTSDSIVGNITEDNIYTLVENAKRERLRQKKILTTGQRWFEKENRKEALDEIGQLISKARERVIFFDPYFGVEQITQFLTRASVIDMEIRIVTSNNSQLTESFKSNLKIVEEKIRTKIDCVIVKEQKLLHDRFLVLDDEIWFLGHSFNQIGESNSLMLKVPEPKSIWRYLQEIEQDSISIDKIQQPIKKSYSIIDELRNFLCFFCKDKK